MNTSPAPSRQNPHHNIEHHRHDDEHSHCGRKIKHFFGKSDWFIIRHIHSPVKLIGLFDSFLNF